jgi:hypothetical protein
VRSKLQGDSLPIEMKKKRGGVRIVQWQAPGRTWRTQMARDAADVARPALANKLLFGLHTQRQYDTDSHKKHAAEERKFPVTADIDQIP